MKEEILEYFKDINHAYNDCTRYDTLKRMIDELQEPKTGDWIEHEVNLIEFFECDQCHHTEVYATNYCPNCGAKMAESEEV